MHCLFLSALMINQEETPAVSKILSQHLNEMVMGKRLESYKLVRS